jgi:hypothetical protein
VRAQVLRWFARAGHLDQTDARDMAGWHHGGGFSLDAAVRIEGSDRVGLERLLRNSRAPALRPGAPRAGRSQPARLSFSQAPARWQHATAADACGTARAAGRADPAPAPAPPPLSRGAPNSPQRA